MMPYPDKDWWLAKADKESAIPDTDIAAGLAAAGVHTHDCQCPACEVTRRIADNQRAAAKAQEGK